MDELWEEKYRPKKIDDFIWINDLIKQKISTFIKNNEIKNLILYSRAPGSGKTSTCRSLVEILNRENLFINFSAEGNLNTLKTKMIHFARTVSFNRKKKIIILDEIDSENTISARNFFNAFRPVIEKYHNNCRFLCTCNNIDIIPDAIQSRFSKYEYVVDDKKRFAKDIFKKCIEILKSENIEFDKNNIVDIIKKYNPDIRSIIKFLDDNKDYLKEENLIYRLTKGKIDKLFKCLKEQDFKTIKELIINNFSDSSIYRSLYDNLKDNISTELIPKIILVLSEYMRYDTIVADKQIHYISMLLEISDIIKE